MPRRGSVAVIDLGNIEHDDPTPPRAQHPKGWEPGVVMLGDTGTVNTGPMLAPPNDWADVLAVWNLDPAEYEVLEPVQFRAWDANLGRDNDGSPRVQRFYYYRANVQRRTGRLDVGDLIRRSRRKDRAPKEPAAGRVFGFAVGDLQIGEWSKDGGSAAVIERFYVYLDQALDVYRAQRKNGTAGGDVVLPWLGDCVQGTNSQGGALVMRLDLTPTQQQQAVETMMADAVERFSKVADRVQLVGIPGNHDETTRIAGKMATRYDDSWAVKAAWSVAETARRANWANVTVRTPDVDELTVTLDLGGTIVGMLHGHQWSGEASKGHPWLGGQAHGRQPVGDADVILTGHRHHWYMETLGHRTVIVVPSVAGDSAWWRHAKGTPTIPGALTFTLDQGRIHPALLS